MASPHAPASRTAPSLTARAIVRSYGANVVLDGVDLHRDTSGVIGLLGPNGSGKSTLLRIIAQAVEPDSGTLEVCGRTVERADDGQARRLTGWVPHEPLAWLDDTVAQNLRYAARLAGERRAVATTLASAAVERWGLADVAEQAVRRLSRGWKQRYSLARADLLEPPVLLLDEPTTGLDDRALDVLDEALRAWSGERIVVVATHDRDWIAGHADELVELDA